MCSPDGPGQLGRAAVESGKVSGPGRPRPAPN